MRLVIIHTPSEKSKADALMGEIEKNLDISHAVGGNVQTYEVKKGEPTGLFWISGFVLKALKKAVGRGPKR